MKMEAVFIHNQCLFRIDGLFIEEPGYFWGERLEMGTDGQFDPTEEYEKFYLADLVKAQTDAILLALEKTVEE